MQRTDFLTDPAVLAAVRGQQYLVLRPAGAVAEEFSRVLRAVREHAPQGVRFPAAPHLTLAGFAAPSRLLELRDTISRWAADTAPLRLAVEGLSVFPAPHRVVIMRVRRTDELTAAMASAREAGRQAGLTQLDDGIAPDRWIFHLSVAYGRGVEDEAAWARFAADIEHLPVALPEEVVRDGELVAYERHEHRALFPLSGPRTEQGAGPRTEPGGGAEPGSGA